MQSTLLSQFGLMQEIPPELSNPQNLNRQNPYNAIIGRGNRTFEMQKGNNLNSDGEGGEECILSTFHSCQTSRKQRP